MLAYISTMNSKIEIRGNKNHNSFFLKEKRTNKNEINEKNIGAVYFFIKYPAIPLKFLKLKTTPPPMPGTFTTGLPNFQIKKGMHANKNKKTFSEIFPFLIEKITDKNAINTYELGIFV